MSKSERLSKAGGQERRGPRSELLLALLVVGYDLAVTPLLKAVEKRINSLRERIEGEITAGTLPDD